MIKKDLNLSNKKKKNNNNYKQNCFMKLHFLTQACISYISIRLLTSVWKTWKESFSPFWNHIPAAVHVA